MPIYEYECNSCCTVLEVIQRISEKPLEVCPECSGPVRKLVSRSSFQLRGGGWYADGYCSAKDNGEKPAAADPTPSVKDSPDKAEKKDKGTADSATPPKKTEKGTGKSPKASTAAT